MRVAFFSDVHANLPALEAALADARAHGATHLIHLGDAVGYGPQPAECLARLREVASGAVLGNHDAAACGLLDPALFNPFARETAERAALALDAEAKAWLRDLPYILEGDGFACAHGAFDAPERFHYIETKEDAAPSFAAMPGHALLVVGHTHIPCVFAQDPGGGLRRLPPTDFAPRPNVRYLVNPGSVGFPRGDRLTADYLLLDTTTGRIAFRAVPYDLAPYRLALVRNGYNPMNYWFLSPTARRRQTEQAFLNPTRPSLPAPPPGAPFAPRARKGLPKGFWILMAILLALVALALATLWPPVPAPPAAAQAAARDNLLPPLAHWVGNHDGATLLRAYRAAPEPSLTLTPAVPPASGTLLSPLLTLPHGLGKLRLSFRVATRAEEGLGYAVRILFLRRDKTQLRGDRHNYKTAGTKSFTEEVPPDAIACRVAFSLDLPGAFTLIAPTLTREP